MGCSELKHYGVLGMKWGVRKASKYQKRRKIRKGTVMYRTTVNSEEDVNGNKYVTYLPPDRDLYRGSYSYDILLNSGKNPNVDPVYENKYKLTKDLKIPSRNEVKEVIDELMKTSKRNDILKENGRAYYKLFIDPDFNDDCEYFYQLEKYSTLHPTVKNFDEQEAGMKKMVIENHMKQYSDYPLDLVFHSTAQSFGVSKHNRELVINELKKRGYNAMVDESGVGTLDPDFHTYSRSGVDPLIIFDGKETLSKVSTTEIDKKTRLNAIKKHDKWSDVANKKLKKEDW